MNGLIFVSEVGDHYRPASCYTTLSRPASTQTAISPQTVFSHHTHTNMTDTQHNLAGQTMTPIGSEGWLGASRYDEGHELHERATLFFQNVKWVKVTELASEMRGVDCQLGGRYSLGHFNLVRRLVFADETSWIIRLRLPEVSNLSGSGEPRSQQDCLKIEVDSMKFLRYFIRLPRCLVLGLTSSPLYRSKSSIPVPEVFAYDSGLDNVVGAPYIFMSYINGTPAEELRMAQDCEPSLFGTAEQDERFRRGMASVHVQLANLRFDRIGSPLQDSHEPEHFTTGPEIETGEGPWKIPEEYYTALARHKLQTAEHEAEPETREKESFSLATRFPALMQRYQQHKTGPFGLYNRDFGAHNVLVDGDFNIVGLIDFDGLVAAPIEFVAQPPQFMDLECPAPGHVETRPLAIERIERTRHLLPQYVKFVRDAIREFEASTETKDQSGLADTIMSDGASIVQGLLEYGMHADSINDRWMVAYHLLSKTETDRDGQ